MQNRNPSIMGRENPREDLKAVLDEGQNRLNANMSAIIFPQMTRSINFNPKKSNFRTLDLGKDDFRHTSV